MTQSSSDSMMPRDVLSLAVCAGLAAACGELVVLAIRKFWFHEVLHLSSNVIWMTPLNDALVFGVLGIALVLLVAAMKRTVTFHIAVFLIAGAAALSTMVFFGVASRTLRVLVAVIVMAIADFALRRGLRAGPRRAVVFACAFAAVYAVALSIPRLYVLAQLLFAVGLSARVGMMIDASPRVGIVARRVLASITVVVMAAGASLGAWHIVRERRATAALPPAIAGARNVIVIIWDTVRSSSLGLYGSPRATTPQLERLAATGVTFDWAFPTAPWTLASHASMFTGRFAHELSAELRAPLDDQFPTVAERLADHGFVTAGFVGNTYYCNEENGLARGFLHYEDIVVSPSEILLSSAFGRVLLANKRLRRLVGYYDIVARRSADDISSSFLHWLDRRPDRPFFVFLNYYDAHLTYLPPEPWRSRFGPFDTSRLWLLDQDRIRTADEIVTLARTVAERNALLDAYDGSIAYLDDRLGMLLDSLRHRGLLENTAVIVASDHGEHFGEHRSPRRDLFSHNKSLYTQELRVPLVIASPDRPSTPVRVPAAVSLRDVATTILDLARVPHDSSIPGRSLARFWQPSPAAVSTAGDTILSETRLLQLRSVVSGQYHLIRGGRDTTELYGLAEDSTEKHNLAKTVEGAPIVAAIDSAYRALFTIPFRHEPARRNVTP